MNSDDEQLQRFEHGHEASQWMLTFAQNAKRSIHIFTNHLAAELYCTDALVKALSAFARANPVSQLRILVRDSRSLHGVDHAIVNLARRLPSHVSIRVLSEDIAEPHIGYFCVDESDLVFFNDEAAHVGFARVEARAEARHWLESFEHLWQKCSINDPNLRLLSI